MDPQGWQWGGTGLTCITQVWGPKVGRGIRCGALIVGFCQPTQLCPRPMCHPHPISTMADQCVDSEIGALPEWRRPGHLSYSPKPHCRQVNLQITPCGSRAGPALGFPLSEGHLSLTGSAVRFSEATFAWEQDGNAAIRE